MKPTATASRKPIIRLRRKPPSNSSISLPLFPSADLSSGFYNKNLGGRIMIFHEPAIARAAPLAPDAAMSQKAAAFRRPASA
jgi:hypothetical protein